MYLALCMNVRIVLNPILSLLCVGKTTQCPQFLLEEYPHAKIVVCQPRRLAAVGVATRVAEEVGGRVGGLVGYMVRGDSKVSDQTRLLFCTYGVILRCLQEDPLLVSIDYIILDEVHEVST